jgi:hypothetical protein
VLPGGVHGVKHQSAFNFVKSLIDLFLQDKSTADVMELVSPMTHPAKRYPHKTLKKK